MEKIPGRSFLAKTVPSAARNLFLLLFLSWLELSESGVDEAEQLLTNRIRNL